MDIKYRLRYLSVLGALFFSTAFMVRPSYSAALQKSEPESEKSGAKSGEAKSNEIPGAPRIALDQIEGSPGASLMIPLYYTPGKNEPLRALAVDIEYVSNHLKFQKAAEGVIPEGVKVNISTNVTDGAPDSKGTVRSKLHISVSEDKSATKPLPEALLTYLLFQVTMDAKPFTIKLTPTVVSAEETNNQKVAKFNTEPGTVTVSIPDMLPEATCFFFSH